MKKALVLCGGGSKGAYQMGVWEALDELNMTFDIVTGTSIGALNGVMYVQGDYLRCLELWDSISNAKIMKNPIELDDLDIKTSIKNIQDLVPFVRGYIQRKGVDITPFKEIMNEYLDYDKFKQSKQEFSVVTVQFPSFKPLIINVNDLDYEGVKTAVLASASCFPLFPICKFGDLNLIDGGYYDNLPIDLALDMGAESVVAVDLNYAITHKEYMNMPNITYIHPSWSLGGFFYFEQETIQNNIILGYNDAMKTFGKYEGFRYTFNKENIDNSLLNFHYLTLLKYDRMLRTSKQKSLVRSEEGSDLFKILKTYTYRDINLKEYYIRNLEVIAEFFKINHLPVYSYQEMRTMILDHIYNVEIIEDDILVKYNKFKSAKSKRELFSNVNKYDLLGTLLKSELNNDILLDLLLTRPKILLIIILLSSWNNESKDK